MESKTQEVADAATVEQKPFDHSKSNIFDACGLSEEVFDKKLEEVNRRTKDIKTASGDIEVLEQVLTPRELALMVKNYQSKVNELIANSTSLDRLMESLKDGDDEPTEQKEG